MTAIVHVVDDDPAMRDSLLFLFGSAGVASVAHPSATAFLPHVGKPDIGCVVTDVRMPGLSGLDLVERLRELRPELPVIVITAHGDIPLAVEAMKRGAADFIEKPFADETLLAAVTAALGRAREDDGRNADRAAAVARLGQLSARERQVLEGLVAGKPNKIIAHDLDISPRTVEVYRANVMTKLQAASLSDLVRMALLAGVG